MTVAAPRRGWLPGAVLVGAAVAFAVVGRNRWADVTVDFDLWYSRLQGCLSGGRILHEVPMMYGPLSMWELKEACRLFGTSVETVVWFQFAAGLLAVVAVQQFASRFLTAVQAIFCAATLAILILWMPGSGNLLYPYAFAVSPALLVAMLSWIAMDRACRRSSIHLAAVSGCLAALSWLTKQDPGVAAVAGCLTRLAFDRASHRRDRGRLLLSWFAAFLGVGAGVLALFASGEPWDVVIHRNALWPFVPIPRDVTRVARMGQGLSNIETTFRDATYSLLLLAPLGVVLLLVARGFAKKLSGRMISVAAAGAWAAGLAVLWVSGAHFAPMALCLPALLAAAAWGLFGSGFESDSARAALVSATVGALLLLTRVGYRGIWEGAYAGLGYVLAVPVLVAGGAALLGALDRGNRRPLGMQLGALMAAVILFVGAWHRRDSLLGWWDNVRPVAGPRGVVYVPRYWQTPLRAAADFIAVRTRGGDPITLLPETKALDFLLERRNVSIDASIGPGFSAGDEQRLIDLWRQQPPRIVVFFEGTTLGDYGRGEFGRGYFLSAMRWIDQRYVLVGREGGGRGPVARLYVPR